jgi:hypothetical protein
VRPVGFPNTALICGSTYCEEPALVWLERHEKAAYDRGERIFKAFTATMKVRAIWTLSPGAIPVVVSHAAGSGLG